MSRNILIFDFFGVICSEIAPYWLAKYFSQEEAVRIKSGLVVCADTGAISQENLFTELGKLANVPSVKVEEEWFSLVEIDYAIVALMIELSPRYRKALLTNSPSPFVRQILRRHKLEAHFEHISISSEERLAKPDPEIFRRLIVKLGALPGDAVMIDDNPANIAGAKSAGLAGILFLSATQLRKMINETIG